ncbi:hypothetical protein HOK021_11720 [Streptomyces hygroscopicus]|nr:hypothetical protein HOK021_11720 [Streptomyces hygroscopicus]
MINTKGTRAQLKAPQRMTSLTGSGDLSDGNGTVCSPRTGCYYNAVGDHGSPRGVRTGAGRGIAIRATLRHAPGNVRGPTPPRTGAPRPW